MKKKGVSSAIVAIAIVIVIAVVGVGGYLLLKGEEGPREEEGAPGGLPEYPGSESFDIPEEYLGEFGLPGGIEMGVYFSDDTVQEILNWYKDQMTGWTLEEEMEPFTYMEMTQGGLSYRKDNGGASIVAFSGMSAIDPSMPEGTCYIIGTGPWKYLEVESLVIAQAADADILDPARTVYPYAISVNNLIYETLVTWDWDMNRIPMLAENWHYNEGGMYYEFELKHGIKFHCGHPFTAEAVVYSINRLKELPGTVYEDFMGSILGAEAVDNYTVKVYLGEPDRYILDKLATSSFAIVCPHCAEEHWLKFGTIEGPPCGTGPFKFESWSPDDNIVLERNENYTWGPQTYQNRGPAYLSRVIFRVIHEDSIRENEFENGKVDFLADIRQNRELLDNYLEDPGIVLYEEPISSLVYLGFNCAGTENHGYGYENGDIPPGSVPKAVPKKVRQAVAYAINENEIIENALDGIGIPAHSWLADSIWSSTPYQENMYPHNPAKARQLLEGTGWNEIELIYYNDPHYADIASVLQRQLDNVGITLNIQQLPFSAYQSRIANKDYNMFIAGYTWPLADMIWWEWHTCRIPSPNRFWWGDDYTDAVIDNTWSMDDGVALEALQEAQRLIAEDAASVGLLHRATVMARRTYVKDFRMHPLVSCWKFLDTYIEK